MKKIIDSKTFQIGITAFLVIAAAIFFYFCLSHLGVLIAFVKNILNILMPLIYGLVLAYIMHPIVNLIENKIFNKIEKKTIRRNLSIFCTLVIIAGILATLISIIIPQLMTSIQSLIVNLPVYFKDFENAIMTWINDSAVQDQSILKNYDAIVYNLTNTLNNIIEPMTNTAINSVFGVFNFIFNFAIGTVFAVYILANTSNFAAGIRKNLYSFFDIEHVDSFINEVKHVNSIFCHFMVGKVCDSTLVACMTFLFLLIFKFPYPLLIAVIIGLTDLIPYFGPYIGTVPSAILICLVSPVKAITFILFIIVLQQIDGNLITPRIQKQATGLPSFWVLFAITLFGGLFGLVGLLIGVPCFTIIYEIFNDQIASRLKKKNMPMETEYYVNIEGLEKKTIKANLKESSK